jgi:hydrogenase expression/formation protein HypE
MNTPKNGQIEKGEHAAIRMDHGSGGRLARQLIEELFLPRFSGGPLSDLGDAALLSPGAGRLAFTTDSHVITPRFFPGGDIGSLAVCGTVNDLAVAGAVPRWLSAGFIIEEGFSIEELDRIAASMANAAADAGVEIAAGDTKVVERGGCDGLFINTAGIGSVPEERSGISAARDIAPGDKILINGTVGDHGLAVTAAREDFDLSTPLLSDCAPLAGLTERLFSAPAGKGIRFMRDPTRGGLATVICELAESRQVGIDLNEEAIPVREEVRGLCELLGYDPLYVANEGKCVVAASAETAEKLLAVMREDPLGREAAIIGEVTSEHPGETVLLTAAGGRRKVDMLSGGQLPRIC